MSKSFATVAMSVCGLSHRRSEYTQVPAFAAFRAAVIAALHWLYELKGDMVTLSNEAEGDVSPLAMVTPGIM